MPKWLHGQTLLVCTIGALGAFHLPWKSEVRAGNYVIPERKVGMSLLAVPVDSNALHSILCRKNVHK